MTACGGRQMVLAAVAVIALAWAASPARAADEPAVERGSLADRSVHWPTWSELARVLTLQDHNTRVVVLGVSCLGLAAGLIGCFMLLRERALLGDALSHATLPGIGIAFLVMNAWGGTGKSLPGLLAGASVSGVLGVLAILFIVHLTRIKEDAALGIVLSVFFGLGVAVTGIIQNLGTGHAAGLNSFIYGKTASMLLADAELIAVTAAVVAAACLILFKEFTLLCFDAGFARSQGWPVVGLDVAMMALVVVVAVIGLQAVGLMLMVALLVIPPAAARFWTEHLPTMLFTSAAIGAASGLLGAALSALVPRLPAGAIIVVVAGAAFLLSMVFGRARGVFVRVADQRRLSQTVARQNLLRALYELTEAEAGATGAAPGTISVSLPRLLRCRSWSARALRRLLAGAVRSGFIERISTAESYVLTEAGTAAAWRVARNHRLWELYLITHADIAPSHVDRGADQVEHVLGPNLLHELETLLAREYPDLAAPASPHRVALPAGR